MTTSGLSRFVGQAEPAPPPETAEVCDLCATPVGDDHDHLVDSDTRALLCACRACALLFTNRGAGAGRYRLIPDRYVHDPAFDITTPEWDALQIPVGLAFFFRHSGLDRWVAFYPSPAGATESVLPLDEWHAVLERNSLLARAEEDVEAILVRRTGGRFSAFLVPVDACYQLVGLVRLHWRGFDGGAEVHAAIDDFFAGVASRSGSGVT